ncbi:hypothetical protein [Kineococcus mangrovi]
MTAGHLGTDDRRDDPQQHLEQRLRREMTEAVTPLATPPWLVAAAVRGGRQRARRRRAVTTALISAPIAVAATTVVVTGTGDPTGWFGPQPAGPDERSSVAATAPTAGSLSTVDPAPTTPPAATPETTASADLTAERASAAAAATQELAREQLSAQQRQWAADLTAQGEPELAAFFGAGYDYADAVALGRIWKLDPSQAKTTAGADLMAGRAVPVTPTADVSRDSPGWEITAFAAAGYSVDDATRLGQLWGLDEWDAQVEGGRRLLAGQVLPLPPSGATVDPGAPAAPSRS